MIFSEKGVIRLREDFSFSSLTFVISDKIVIFNPPYYKKKRSAAILTVIATCKCYSNLPIK